MVFISRKKLLIYSRYSNFCPQCFGHVVHQLDKNSRQVVKSQPEKQTITIHIFSNISRSKCNQTIKPSQLIEYNMKNIFVGKSNTKCGGETSPRSFSENQN